MTAFQKFDTSALTPAQAADMLGNLKAFISDLTKQEEALKAVLIASGQREVEGEVFRATVSTADRTTLDTQKLREILPDFVIAQCERVSTSTTVRVAARKRAA